MIRIFLSKKMEEDFGLHAVRIEPILGDGIKGAHRSIYIDRKCVSTSRQKH